MKNILKSDNVNCLIGIPDFFGSLSPYNDSARRFWRKFLCKNRASIYKLLDFDKQYSNTALSRPYIDFQDKSQCGQYFEKAKELWQNKNIVIVEGRGSRLGVGNDLFKNASSIKRILCPVKDAYDYYEEIFETCLTQSKSDLFILALGPTATVLAYDLSNSGYQALDMGHIDVEYEWFLKKAESKIPIENKYVNEAHGGSAFGPINNDDYEKEIIAKIGE